MLSFSYGVILVKRDYVALLIPFYFIL